MLKITNENRICQKCKKKAKDYLRINDGAIICFQCFARGLFAMGERMKKEGRRDK